MKPLVSLIVRQWEAVIEVIDFTRSRGEYREQLKTTKDAIEQQLGWADPEAGHSEPEYACRLCNPEGGPDNANKT